MYTTIIDVGTGQQKMYGLGSFLFYYIVLY